VNFSPVVPAGMGMRDIALKLEGFRSRPTWMGICGFSIRGLVGRGFGEDEVGGSLEDVVVVEEEA
jgi:hypothetical protein